MPNVYGQLTPDDHQKIRDWWAVHWTKPVLCPVCRINNWVLGTHVINIERCTAEGASSAAAASPHISVMCQKCAHTMLFNASAIGIANVPPLGREPVSAPERQTTAQILRGPMPAGKVYEPGQPLPTSVPYSAPAVAPAPAAERVTAHSGSANGAGDLQIDPIIHGLLLRLPDSGEVWTETERKLWMEIIETSFKLIYKEPDPGTERGLVEQIRMRVREVAAERKNQAS